MATKGRTWILDTETKGTGARMVPLDSADEPPEPSRPKPIWVPPKRKPKPPPEPAPRPPRRFKVVDILTRQVLAEDAGLRETLELLGTVRSSVDVDISVWEPDGWRMLTHRERLLLWDRRRS